MSDVDGTEPGKPKSTHERPVIRNVVLLVLFLVVVLVGVVTVLLPALDAGTEDESGADEEVTSESTDPTGE